MAKDTVTLTPELLLRGYMVGIFPMSNDANDPDVEWVDPVRRGVLPLDRFHMSRSLARAMRRTDARFAVNTDFAGTVDACAARQNTWINDPIRWACDILHQDGYAQSFELWRGGVMIGGVYGITLGGAFFGESMFSRETNGSKMALAGCVDHLRRGGFTLFDTQFLTDHLASLGAVEVSRSTYHNRLSAALRVKADWFAPTVATPREVADRFTQAGRSA